jgi:DNA-binding SARP family transcriptional activator
MATAAARATRSTASATFCGAAPRSSPTGNAPEVLHQESLELFEALDDRSGVAHAHGYLGFAAWMQGQWETACRHCDRALRDFRALGDSEGIAWSLISLGTVAQYRGDLDQSAAQLTTALTLSRQAGYPEGVAWAGHELGLLAMRQGDPARAEELLARSLERHRELGDRWRTASVLDDLAATAVIVERPDRAAALLGAAAAIRADIGTVIAPCERADHDTVEERARLALGPDAFSAAWSQGHDSPIDDLPAAGADLPRQSLPLRSQLLTTAPAAAAPSPLPAAPPAGAREQQAPGSRQLRIRMLGAATVRYGDRVLTAADFGYGKPRELLWLLASIRRQTKEQIGLSLWPELSGTQLRNAFHTALRDLRRALGDPVWVVFTDGAYALDRSRDLWSDLQVFESSLVAARRAEPKADALPHLQRAVAAYGGDFLPDNMDAEWVDTRRGELRRVFGAALAATGRLLAATDRYVEAAEIYRISIEHDPLEESAHRHLMSCLIRMGESAQAARLYQELSQRLKDELGVAPSTETTTMYKQLRRRR